MKAKDIRALSNEELAGKERDLREELFKLSFQHKVRKLENTGKLRQLRKDIARVRTILQEKQA
jgi:large subunit ribosomal protein L29